MKPALQSYTPTVHVLNYDSLDSRAGCDVQTGGEFYGVLAPHQLCVFAHDADNPKYNQPPTVSYQLGPAVQGGDLPHQTLWTAWIATEGVRIGKVPTPLVPPADDLGVASSLFPGDVSTKITHCFDSDGLVHIAIHKPTPGFINLKWYTDESGTMADTSWAGTQPLLFNFGLMDGSLDVVCYYLRQDKPFCLFARYKQDNFVNEYQITDSLRVNIVLLSRAVKVGDTVEIYGRDDDGRDVKITIGPFAIQLSDRADIGALFEKAEMFRITTDPVLLDDAAEIGASFFSASMIDGTAETQPIAVEKMVIGTSFESAEIEPA